MSAARITAVRIVPCNTAVVPLPTNATVELNVDAHRITSHRIASQRMTGVVCYVVIRSNAIVMRAPTDTDSLPRMAKTGAAHNDVTHDVTLTAFNTCNILPNR